MSKTPLLAIALATAILAPASASAICVNPDRGAIEIRNSVVVKGIEAPTRAGRTCPRGSTEVRAPRIATGGAEFKNAPNAKGLAKGLGHDPDTGRHHQQQPRIVHRERPDVAPYTGLSSR